MPSRTNPKRAKRTFVPSFKTRQRTTVAPVVRKSRMVHVNEHAINSLSTGNDWWDPLAISHGTDHSDRTSNTITVTGISMRGILQNNQANTQVIRIVVLQTDLDAQFGNTTDFLEAPYPADQSASITDEPGLNSIVLPIDTQVAKPLYDKVFVVGRQDRAEGCKQFKHFIKFPGGLKINYRGGATGAANVFPRIHIGAWSAEADDDVVTGETTELSATFKLYFHDG